MANQLSEYVRKNIQESFSLSPELPLRTRVERFLQAYGRAAVEYKFDGTRVFLVKRADVVLLATKHNGVYVPPSLQYLKVNNDIVLDCEYKIKRDELFVFDIIHNGGVDQRFRTYLQRRNILESAVKANLDNVHIVDYKVLDTPGDVLAYYDRAIGAGQEGIMMKDPTAPYGTSKHSWVKLKQFETCDCVVIKGKPTESTATTGKFVTWNVGVYDGSGSLVHICDVSSCLLGIDRSKILPGTVVEVRYQPTEGFTSLRHPTILRIRTDKTADECRLDQFPWLLEQGRIT